MRNRRYASLAWCALLASSPAWSDNEALVTRLADLKTEHNVPVLAVAIITPDNTWSRVWGARLDVPLRWGSITKTVTARTALKLSERGVFTLDDPLAKHIDPGLWQNRWRATHPVRVGQLLDLTAGFPDLSGKAFSYNEPMSLNEALAFAPDHRRTLWPPGLAHGYTNLAPGLTQKLIEQATGTSFAAAVRREVFEPLGMAAATFVDAGELPGGFKADGRTEIDYWQMTYAAFGAMNAPLGDLVRLVQTLMAETPPKPTTTLAARAGFAFSYAGGIYPRVRGGHVWYSHGGDADGYRSRYAFLADGSRGYVININVDNPRLLRRIETILETHLAAGLARPTPPPRHLGTDLDQLTGIYYPATTRFGVDQWQAGDAATLNVARAGDDLIATRGDRRTRLIAVRANRFRRPDDPVATVAFVREPGRSPGDDGALFVQGELGSFLRLGDCPSYFLTDETNFFARQCD